jgi:hypothetical protein
MAFLTSHDLLRGVEAHTARGHGRQPCYRRPRSGETHKSLAVVIAIIWAASIALTVWLATAISSAEIQIEPSPINPSEPTADR